MLARRVLHWQCTVLHAAQWTARARAWLLLRPFVQGADCCRVGCHRLLVALRSRALVAAEAVCARSGLLPLYAATMAIGWRSAVAPPPPPASRDRVMRTHNTLNVVTHINARLVKGFLLIRIGRVTHHPLDLT